MLTHATSIWQTNIVIFIFFWKFTETKPFPEPRGSLTKLWTFPVNKDPWEPWIPAHHILKTDLNDLPGLITAISNLGYFIVIHNFVPGEAPRVSNTFGLE